MGFKQEEEQRKTRNERGKKKAHLQKAERNCHKWCEALENKKKGRRSKRGRREEVEERERRKENREAIS